jgi:hypothetical protein
LWSLVSLDCKDLLRYDFDDLEFVRSWKPQAGLVSQGGLLK